MPFRTPTSRADGPPTEATSTPLRTLLGVPAKPQPKYRRIDATEASLILRLRHSDGLGIEAIAAATKRSLSTISEFLSKYPDTTAEALAILKTAAADAAQSWAGSIRTAAAIGNHRPARDLLTATGTIKDIPTTAVAVQVNMPGSPLPPELIDLSVPDEP